MSRKCFCLNPTITWGSKLPTFHSPLYVNLSVLEKYAWMVSTSWDSNGSGDLGVLCSTGRGAKILPNLGGKGKPLLSIWLGWSCKPWEYRTLEIRHCSYMYYVVLFGTCWSSINLRAEGLLNASLFLERQEMLWVKSDGVYLYRCIIYTSYG